MAVYRSTATDAPPIPDLPAGTVLRLAAGEWGWAETAPLDLVATRVRVDLWSVADVADLAATGDGWVWVEGSRAGRVVQVRVRLSALRALLD